ncbi:aminotransferase class I/II-fold pyridoxal phosphate-dependent enzyme [Streptomyces sp. NBC_00250]|uniref:aminotransferase class I/II-fold pyridoxal phosphate-dependent enzyme n=1 Tax=Streptomyces sp. NBC_00250 TaxID=2903641 RepID=UPI002E294BE8|nr:aminotransferase class I/II-fold pyridoxal phosphate-dependent enzyme [Streptomyces sp. NBC_00250]
MHDASRPTVPVRDRALRIQHFRPSVFSEMRDLAVRTGAVDVGQGAPAMAAPAALTAAVTAAVAKGLNQYSPAAGLPELRESVASYRRRTTGVRYRPDTEVVITAGATEALSAALLALCDPGDEVLTFDPCYDAYSACADLAGARLVTVPLASADDGFALDEAALRAGFGPRTRVLLFNTPHNPTGKVFTDEELAVVAALCQEHGVIVVADEVYEHLTYDGRRHRTIAALPGMRERTLVVSGAGKTFNVTGWRIGWACGPAPLVDALLSVKQFVTFSAGTPFQAAVAGALWDVEGWTAELREELSGRRTLLRDGLEAAGLPTLAGEGGYFVLADVRGWGYTDDVEFCRDLPTRAGVVAIPCSAFHHRDDAPRWLARFAFCKSAEAVTEAVARLGAAGKEIARG